VVKVLDDQVDYGGPDPSDVAELPDDWALAPSRQTPAPRFGMSPTDQEM
jgi:hypothetical protein